MKATTVRRRRDVIIDLRTGDRQTRERRFGLLNRARTFADVIRGPLVIDAVVADRMVKCLGGAETDRCRYLHQHNGRTYCGACGCGAWRLAELAIKNRFAQWECPRNPPLFEAVTDPALLNEDNGLLDRLRKQLKP